MTVIYILAALFITLFLVIPLIERSKTRISEQDMAKIGRWVWPLVMLLLVLQLLLMVFR